MTRKLQSRNTDTQRQKTEPRISLIDTNYEEKFVTIRVISGYSPPCLCVSVVFSFLLNRMITQFASLVEVENLRYDYLFFIVNGVRDGCSPPPPTCTYWAGIVPADDLKSNVTYDDVLLITIQNLLLLFRATV